MTDYVTLKKMLLDTILVATTMMVFHMPSYAQPGTKTIVFNRRRKDNNYQFDQSFHDMLKGKDPLRRQISERSKDDLRHSLNIFAHLLNRHENIVTPRQKKRYMRKAACYRRWLSADRADTQGEACQLVRRKTSFVVRCRSARSHS